MGRHVMGLCLNIKPRTFLSLKSSFARRASKASRAALPRHRDKGLPFPDVEEEVPADHPAERPGLGALEVAEYHAGDQVGGLGFALLLVLWGEHNTRAGDNRA